MKTKVFFVVTLFWVLFIATIASAQQEEITLSTYYPAPFGEYDELCAEKLLVSLPSAAELQDMARGDCHITRSLIVGTAGGGFSYDALNAAGTPLYDGDVIIEGSVGIGTTGPGYKLTLATATTSNSILTNSSGLSGQGIFLGVLGAPGSHGIVSDGNDTGDAAIVFTRDGWRSRTIDFYTSNVVSDGALSHAMRINESGNVGIGTTGPTMNLHFGNSNYIGLPANGYAPNIPASWKRGNAGGIIMANSQNPDGSGWAYGSRIINHDYGDGLALSFDTLQAGVWTNNVLVVSGRAGSNGNVGIGTTSPQAKLHIGGTAGVDGIRFPDNTLMTTAAAIGTVANVVMVQTRQQATYSAPTSGNGTVITPLNLVITPKKAGNRIILEWIVNGEMFQDTVYIVTRNGILLADTTNPTNNRWAGITAQPYDANTNSTHDNAVVKIIDMNSLDVATTYELRVRSSSGGLYYLYLNRTQGSTGQDAYEAGLSVGTATEIWW